MEKGEKFQREKKREKIGGPGYINENCWLVKTLNYTPYKRCQHCELKFRNCLFLHYQIISSILILFFLALSFLIKGVVSELVIISVFTLVIVYGYFFNKSTDKIIQAYFAQRKAKEALEELAESLEKQVEQRTKELKRAYQALEKLDRLKSEFISIASHQLRAPLTVIKGYISQVLEGTYGKINGIVKEKLERVYQSNERLKNFVNNLLNLSRIEAGKIEMNFEKVNLEKIISDLIRDLEFEAKEKKIFLKFEKPKEKLPLILLDEEKIRQVILNVIHNAVKYTEKGGVLVKIKDLKTKIQVIIKDTGIGMRKEELAFLFESFSRGRTTSRTTEGAGLGLYIARRFVELQKGKIWAESEGEGKGSTFYIELPIR